MQRPRSLFTLLSLLLPLCSCQGPRSSAEAVLREWIGREVHLPDNVVLRNVDGDTFALQMVDTARFKVVSYIDSTGCAACKLGAAQWKGWMDRIRREGLDATVILFLSPKDEDSTWELLRSCDFTYPVCVAPSGQIGQGIANWPTQEAYRTFLLDKTNRVVAMGNPAHNDRVSQLYLDIIIGKGQSKIEHSPPMANTTVVMVPETVDLGRFPKEEEQLASFQLHNVGRVPLLVLEATSTCSCIEIAESPKSVSPGEVGTVVLKLKATNSGRLHRSIWLRCNVDDALIKLVLTGEAI